jgi:cytochrome c oxidase subunit 1
MTGKMFREEWARIAWFFIFVGLNATFFIMFVMGVKGLPRRWAQYPPEFQWMQVFSTVGSWILAIGVTIMFINFVHALFRGKPAPANPWRALSLEWQTTSPPETENFEEIPVVTEWPYSYGKKPGVKDA